MFTRVKSFLFHNTSDKQTVAKNTVWLSISNFGGRLIKAVVVIYAARVLGAAGWGVFSYAVTLAGFLTLFMDPGVNSILMRDASKAPEREQKEILSTTFVMKLCFIAIGVVLVLFVAPIFSTLPGAKELLPLVALIIIFDTLREFFSAFFRSQEKMELDAAIFLFMNLSVVVFGLIFLIIKPVVASFAWGYVAGTALGCIAALWVIRRYLKKIFSFFSKNRVLPILKSAWPFAVTGALGILLTNTDILIISWMRSASEVGIYSAAIRIIQILYIVPYILQASTLPILSRLANHDTARFRAILEKTLHIAFLVAIPMAIAGVLLGTQIMNLVFGAAYISGGMALGILMLTMLADYPAMIVGTATFTYDRQRNLIISTAIAGTLNVAFDLLFIPHWGIAGSAWATLIAQAASNAYLWYALKKINYFTVLPNLKKIIGATAGMALGVFALIALKTSAIIIIPAGVILYFALLTLLREPFIKELKGFYDARGQV